MRQEFDFSGVNVGLIVRVHDRLPGIVDRSGFCDGHEKTGVREVNVLIASTQFGPGMRSKPGS